MTDDVLSGDVEWHALLGVPFPGLKRLADGRWAYLLPLTFGRARIGVCRDLSERTGLDDEW